MSEQCTLFFFSLLFLSLFFLLFPLLLLPLFLLLRHPPPLLLQSVKTDKNLFFMSLGTNKCVNGASEWANGKVLYTSEVVLSICIKFPKPLSVTLSLCIWDVSDIEIDALNRCRNLTIEFDKKEQTMNYNNSKFKSHLLKPCKWANEQANEQTSGEMSKRASKWAIKQENERISG